MTGGLRRDNRIHRGNSREGLQVRLGPVKQGSLLGVGPNRAKKRDALYHPALTPVRILYRVCSFEPRASCYMIVNGAIES
jgi:hypothetical protein